MRIPGWRSRQPQVTGPGESAVVLLASPGRPFSDAAVQAALLAAGAGRIRVLSTAKIYGTALGLQHPGLLPSKREISAQEEIIGDAVKRIERRRWDGKRRAGGYT